MKTAILLGAILAISGCAGTGKDSSTVTIPSAGASAQRPESHARMVALLAQIARDTPRANDYLGESDLPALREHLASLPERASVAARGELEIRIGIHELRLGNNDAAIESLESAHDLLAVSPAAARIRAAYYLGLAYARRGETENCVAGHNEDSCILPIRGKGVHTRTEGSRNAIRFFTEVLGLAEEGSDEFESARWLLNIAAMTLGEYPDGVAPEFLIPAETFASDEEFPRFRQIATERGLGQVSLSGGAVAEDFDGDGDLDIVTSSWDPEAPMRFYRNDGTGRFLDDTAGTGLEEILGGLNLVHADYDNDGDVDVLVLRGAWLGSQGNHPNSLLQNDGTGVFTDVTFDAGLGRSFHPTQTASWADYDHDGDLDLYVGNEADLDGGLWHPNELFRNNGDGTFTDVAKEAGVQNLRYAKAVVWGDYDDDRHPDLYVSNLGEANRLYRNNGDGTFRDVAPETRVTAPRDSFPAWFWDFDNDGVLDIFVSSYYQAPDVERLAALARSYLGLPNDAEPACLYRGDGKGGFEDVAGAMNLVRLHYPMGSNFGDIDHDGFLDFYLGTGYPAYDGLMPNVLYRNRGGRGFADVSTAGGFSHLQKGHGVVFADFDRDGDQDVFEEMGGAFPGDRYADAFYENPGFGNHWLGVRLVGVRSNRSAIGARIRVTFVENGTRRTVYRHVNGGGSFGGNPFRQQIGVAGATKVETLEVYWPATDLTQRFHDLDVDRFVVVTEGEDRVAPES